MRGRYEPHSRPFNLNPEARLRSHSSLYTVNPNTAARSTNVNVLSDNRRNLIKNNRCHAPPSHQPPGHVSTDLGPITMLGKK